MAITANKVVNLAKGELGYEEKKSNSQLNDKHANAGKNNFTKYEKDVFGSNGNYWCASFIAWLFYMAAGASKTAAKLVVLCLSMSCETIRQTFIKAKRYDNNPKVGDLIFFKGTRHSGANHIGLVIAVTSTKVTTIEGNTSNAEFDDNGGAVAQKSYDRNSTRILGYAHPKYDAGSTNSGGGSTTLKGGSKGENVKTLQRNLNTVMNAGLSVDGEFGPGTKSAVIKFQKKYGLEADGIYGPASAKKMTEVLASKSTIKIALATLKRGSTGTNVKTLQRNLNKAINAGLSVDGSFGAGTQAAVKTFQKKYGLTPDGIYGPASAAKMKAVLG